MDRNMLNYCIKRAGCTQRELAHKMGISISNLQFKMAGRVKVTIPEAKTIKEILALSDDEFIRIFIKE